MSNRRADFARLQRDQAAFSQQAIGMPLYLYQTDWAQYAKEIATERRNEVVTVEMPRQSGKNETSAHLEVGLLAAQGRKGGDIVKCAPTWQPQIVASMKRFDDRAAQLNERLRSVRFRPKQTYMRICERASISFLSAAPTANVVGATASMLLEVDEAQDVGKGKYDKDFAPMRASTGAPVVLYGTTWTSDTLLAREKRSISEGRVAGRIFRITPDRVAEENPAYGRFVDSQIAAMGRNHPIVKTQYFLEELENQGRVFNAQQLRLMIGQHQPATQRTNEAQIVAGLDFAGADENAGELVSMATGSNRDSVALSIGSLHWMPIADGIVEPIVRVLARYEWVNVNPVTLHSALYRLLGETWKVDKVCCDETGVGSAPTAFLRTALNKYGRDIVDGRIFDSAWNTHSELATKYIAAAYGGRVLDPQTKAFDPIAKATQESADTEDPHVHSWWQRGHARLEAKETKRMRLYVPDSEGHDDLLLSDMLMTLAAHECGQPRTIQTANIDFYG